MFVFKLHGHVVITIIIIVIIIIFIVIIIIILIIITVTFVTMIIIIQFYNKNSVSAAWNFCIEETYRAPPNVQFISLE